MAGSIPRNPTVATDQITLANAFPQLQPQRGRVVKASTTLAIPLSTKAVLYSCYYYKPDSSSIVDNTNS